ncbi:MAG TPA: aminopeptidase, partial [Rectinemataceae bacterium]|nr:aminopeptidase [Rectinemataceae bacterium]
MRSIAAILASLVLAAGLSSCYVTSQASRYLAIRSRAVPVDRALADPRTPATLRALLDRAVAVRAFAESSIGLKRTRNFGSIVQLEGDHLASVVSACAELGFRRYLWTYPLVGRLPYRGYFDQAQADAEAARLKKLGLDVIVRPVDAF